LSTQRAVHAIIRSLDEFNYISSATRPLWIVPGSLRFTKS
jgi:hypothetical protein